MSSKSKKSGMKIDRTLVVVDLENLCGGSDLIGCCHRAASAVLRDLVGEGPVTYVIATGPSAREDTPTLPFDWPGARWLTGHGVDGADEELVDVIFSEPIAIHSQRVVVVSGDHRFAPALHFLACEGVETTVISRQSALSRASRLAAKQVVTIPDFVDSALVPMEAA